MKAGTIILICFVLLTGACSSSKQTSANQTDATATATDERDGSSLEKAIIVDNIGAEYEWLRKNCAGCKFVQQSLLQKKGKHYDMLTVELPNGAKKDYYFDINSFFGKF